MSAVAPLLVLLREATEACYEAADAISSEHPAEDLHDEDTEDTVSLWAELPSRRGRALELVEHEH